MSGKGKDICGDVAELGEVVRGGGGGRRRAEDGRSVGEVDTGVPETVAEFP